MNWASQRLRAMQTGNARQLAAESVVEAACCRACCQMIDILVEHAKANYERLKAATWVFPSATVRCRICMILLASASPRRRILVLELRSVSQRIPVHSCLHSAQLSSDHVISSCASMQITFRGQAKQHIIQMSITQQSMDINEDYLHCAFRSRARPGFTCLRGPGSVIYTNFMCLGGLGSLWEALGSSNVRTLRVWEALGSSSIQS